MLKQSPSSERDTRLDTRATDNIVGYRLRRAQLNVFNRFLSVFSDMEIRPADYAMLVLIADNPGRRQTDIADALGIKQANFVTLIQAMEARGLIERRPAATDKRAKALHLTSQGSAFVAQARARHDAFEDDLLERLGDAAARDMLLNLLARLG